MDEMSQINSVELKDIDPAKGELKADIINDVISIEWYEYQFDPDATTGNWITYTTRRGLLAKIARWLGIPWGFHLVNYG